MNGIALLLAAGDTVESVHQAAWFALLKHSEFLSCLGLPSLPTSKVEWEPDGGIFDLAVKAESGTVWIELKVDSGLTHDQLKRQFGHAQLGDSVIYALLGLERIRARPWATDIISDHKGSVIDTAQVREALDKVQNSTSATSGVKDLARAYAVQLNDLEQRGSDFRTAINPWLGHDQCFFDELRRACPEMGRAHIGYVANHSGGFEACHWGWAEAGEGSDCYLQWERKKFTRRLCFKIKISDQAVAAAKRTTAMEFLRDHPLGSTHIRRPRKLGTGGTMTVGIVEDLPIGDEARWPELIRTMTEATVIVERLALHLKPEV